MNRLPTSPVAGPPQGEPSDGPVAVGLARRTLDEWLGRPAPPDIAEPYRSVPLPAGFDRKRGVFVTLRTVPADDLRGCIGFPLPVYPLRAAIPRAAYAAATEDPRFTPLRAVDLGRTRIEVSLLSIPERLTGDPATWPGLVRVGRDGLIVEAPGRSGLLLPQVAPEQGWDSRELLEGTCEKAGLPPATWRQPEVRVFRFGAAVFEERAPRGAIVERSD